MLPVAGAHLGTWIIPAAWVEWMWDFGCMMGHSLTSHFPLSCRVFPRNLGLITAPYLILDSELGVGRGWREELAAAGHPHCLIQWTLLLSLTEPLTCTPGMREDGQEVGSWCLEILQVCI